MKHELRAVAAAAAVALFAAPASSGAAPLAASSGIRSSGTLVVVANVQGEPLNVGGNVALYHRGALYRLDLLSLGFPGNDKTASALVGALLGPGGATVIYDGATGALSAYSNTNRTFYSEAPREKAAAAPAASVPGAQSAAGSDPLAMLSSFVRQLHDVQRASVQMTGHATTNGHPVSDVDVQLRRQTPGKPLEDYHAQLALADDLDGFPVRIAFSSTPATKSAFGGSMKLDLTTVQRDSPGDEIFAVPSGYARVNSIGEVLRRR